MGGADRGGADKGNANRGKGQKTGRTLASRLDLERLEQNLFRGHSPQDGWQRVFGGQVIGQALHGALQTVEPDRFCHSLHAYFLRPGDPAIPIIYEVERIRDGGSFATRRVLAIQHGAVIFSMSCSFHGAENGPEHQIPMPEAPPPEKLPSEAELLAPLLNRMPPALKAYWQGERAIELRPVDFKTFQGGAKQPARRLVWMRPTQPLPDDHPLLHQGAIAFATDLSLLDTTLLPQGRTLFDPDLFLASLDHALWFHRPARFDDWLLYATDSPVTHGARGLARGFLFSRQGRLVASTAQEGLIRTRPAD